MTRARRVVLALALGAALHGANRSADAREFGLHSPSGRRIYRPNERFDELLDHRRRSIVSEVAVGAGPEGNLALLMGCLNLPIRRMDVFAGIGVEANPAALVTGSARYTFHAGPFRPYVAVGYLYKHTYEVGIVSHNVFGEIGHTWVLHRTLRLSVGVGVRRMLRARLVEDSFLAGPSVDPQALSAELDAIEPWLPLGAVRFSRAF